MSAAEFSSVRNRLKYPLFFLAHSNFHNAIPALRSIVSDLKKQRYGTLYSPNLCEIPKFSLSCTGRELAPHTAAGKGLLKTNIEQLCGDCLKKPDE